MKYYEIAMGESWSEITRMVNHMMREGWEPVGGISITKVDTQGVRELWAQAMVKTSQDD